MSSTPPAAPGALARFFDGDVWFSFRSSPTAIVAAVIAFETRLAKGQYDSLLSGWIADNADPDNFFRQLLSCAAVERGNNYSRWCSPAFDQLLDDAVTTPQLAFRLRNYYYAQTLLNEQMPLIPLAHALRTQVSRSDIEGLSLMPFGGTVFNQAYRE